MNKLSPRSYLSYILSVVAFTILFLFVFPAISLATSGCCSWHGGVAYCDSSVGKLVCNDGTYSPSCTCAVSTPAPEPVYVPVPVCNLPGPVPSVDYNLKIEDDTCGRYTVDFSWSPVADSTGYVVLLDQIEGTDPGTAANVTATSKSYTKQSPGVYYLHIKSVNSCGVSGSASYKLEIPAESATIKATAQVVKGKQKINWTATCSERVFYKIDGEENELDSLTGSIDVEVEETTDYRFYAIGPDGKPVEAKVSVEPLKSVESEKKDVLGVSDKASDENSEPLETKSSTWDSSTLFCCLAPIGVLGALVFAVIGFILIFKKKKVVKKAK